MLRADIDSLLGRYQERYYVSGEIVFATTKTLRPTAKIFEKW